MSFYDGCAPEVVEGLAKAMYDHSPRPQAPPSWESRSEGVRMQWREAAAKVLAARVIETPAQ